MYVVYTGINALTPYKAQHVYFIVAKKYSIVWYVRDLQYPAYRAFDRRTPYSTAILGTPTYVVRITPYYVGQKDVERGPSDQELLTTSTTALRSAARLGQGEIEDLSFTIIWNLPYD